MMRSTQNGPHVRAEAVDPLYVKANEAPNGIAAEVRMYCCLRGLLSYRDIEFLTSLRLAV